MLHLTPLEAGIAFLQVTLVNFVEPLAVADRPVRQRVALPGGIAVPCIGDEWRLTVSVLDICD